MIYDMSDSEMAKKHSILFFKMKKDKRKKISFPLEIWKKYFALK